MIIAKRPRRYELDAPKNGNQTTAEYNNVVCNLNYNLIALGAWLQRLGHYTMRPPNGIHMTDNMWELPGLVCSTQVFEHAVSSGMRKAAQMDVVVSPPCVAVVSRLS